MIMELHNAALFNILYFATAHFEEVQALETGNIRISPRGNLEINFYKGKKNQTMEHRSSIIAPSVEAIQLCPVAVIVQYRNVLMREGPS